MKLELKLRLLDPDAWGALLSHPLLDLHALSPVPMDAVYFDTADGALNSAGIAYRVRREGERWIATVQGVGTSAGGLHQRPEWTVVVEDKPSPQVFAGTEAGAMLFAAVGENILLPLLETHFQRFERELRWEDGSGILIAADRGEIRAGRSSWGAAGVGQHLGAGFAATAGSPEQDTPRLGLGWPDRR
uniref:Adenylate cyclase n=1 Tax=mine drainage metagenome TaxID=410659 RepID=E6QAE8_9ZZZZ